MFFQESLVSGQTEGSSTLNITVEEPEIIENCSRLLKEIGWRGCADIDLIYDPRGRYCQSNGNQSESFSQCKDIVYVRDQHCQADH